MDSGSLGEARSVVLMKNDYYPKYALPSSGA
jgi:hypothetical protein